MSYRAAFGIAHALYRGMKTKVAIPIWQERVSPVMDSACRLMVVDFDDGRVAGETTVDIPQLHIVQKVRFLCSLGIDALICGAVSHELESMITSSGIEVNPFYRGTIQDIIAAYGNGNLKEDRFFLPGCRNGGRGRGRGRGRCRGGRGMRRGRFN